jgi:large subunit ribosomal protein LX
MPTYTVAGRFETGRGTESFERSVEAVNESVAREHTYAEFGSQHGLKRNRIDIETVEQ